MDGWLGNGWNEASAKCYKRGAKTGGACGRPYLICGRGVALFVGGGRGRLGGGYGGRQRACRKAKSAPIAVLGSRWGRGAL